MNRNCLPACYLHQPAERDGPAGPGASEAPQEAVGLGASLVVRHAAGGP